MYRRFKDLIAVQGARRTIRLLSVIVLTAVAGCSNEEPAGTPEKVGDFTLQKFTNWYATSNGSRSTMNYTKMTYGHLFKRDVVFPEVWKNKILTVLPACPAPNLPGSLRSECSLRWSRKNVVICWCSRF